MIKIKLKEPVNVKKKKNVYFLLDGNNNIRKFKPWLGDMFSFLYDKIMEKSIFPKLFNGNIDKHFEILEKELKNIHNFNIVEIATGSGTSAQFIPNDNKYTGIDISPGLLRKAYSRFRKHNFINIELYNTSADNLPFQDDSFNFAICNLSLNFFDDIDLFIKELKRVLIFGSTFFCSVPVPERKLPNSKIRGTLYSEKELKVIFEKYGFSFESKKYENGALLYFSVILNKSDN